MGRRSANVSTDALTEDERQRAVQDPPQPERGAPEELLGPALADDAEHNLLSSPIERSVVNRAFVIGGPLALLVTIIVSLWVSWSHVRFFTVVQADQTWVPGQTRAVRVQVGSDRGYEPGEVDVTLTLEHAGTSTELGTLLAVGPGVAQGTVMVPAELPAGAATVRVHVPVEPEPIDEVLAIELSTTPATRTPTHVVSSSLSQYADDTDPQPDNVKIDIRAHGRVQTGFDNAFFLRVTDASGRPWSGPVELLLLNGELAQRVGTSEAPVTLVRGTTDRLGLLRWNGELVSETVRLEARVMSTTVAGEVVAKRVVKLVSFAGVVTVAVDPEVADAGAEIELAALGLSGKRLIYVDVHDERGAWIETLPPIAGRSLPRPWTLPEHPATGVMQLEAYDQPNAPGESAAVARLQVAQRGNEAVSLRPLVDAQKEALSLPRVDKSFDETRERAWLDDVGALDLSSSEIVRLRGWLLGTLPVSVYGPPAAMSTRQRDLDAMAEFKRRWTIALRWVLLGGGGLFLLAMTLMMFRALERGAAQTRAELREIADEEDGDLVLAHVDRARRGAMLRGLGLIAVMAGALILAVLMLETMVWEF